MDGSGQLVALVAWCAMVWAVAHRRRSGMVLRGSSLDEISSYRGDGAWGRHLGGLGRQGASEQGARW
jgi:hypothetical protein